MSTNKYIELAKDKCYDWRPTKHWECNEIELIYFDRKGLQEFINGIVESEKRKNEK